MTDPSRELEIHSLKETDRQMDRQTDRQTDSDLLNRTCG